MNKEKSKKVEIEYCPQCGAPNKEDSLFCENCGHDIRKEKQPPLFNQRVGIIFGFLGVICIVLFLSS
ncbi:MAG: zinc-ribbon domain-containing protein [Methanomicrobia archaeon]|nr:zinc-ribbon domain-containing protein [Methanomicrobia archaeon]